LQCRSISGAVQRIYALRLQQDLVGSVKCRFNRAKMCDNVVRFSLRADTPATPGDLERWKLEANQAWLLKIDDHTGNNCGPDGDTVDGKLVRFSNDALFEGFQLKESLGQMRVAPRPYGNLPRQASQFSLEFETRSELRLSGAGTGGRLYLRLEAPLGIEFEPGCLAATPDPDFEFCAATDRLAVITIREASFATGEHKLVVRGVNAVRTPEWNWWTLETFVDVAFEAVQAGNFEDIRQRGRAVGFTLDQSLQATLRPGSQEAGNTQLYLWLRPNVYVPPKGFVEIHAAQDYFIQCMPAMVYLAMHPGSCKSFTASSGSEYTDYHAVIEFQVNEGFFLLPNVEYELSISARNPPSVAAGMETSWGVLLRDETRYVIEGNMEIPSYNLTSFGVMVLSLQASTAEPYARNQVRLILRFDKQLVLSGISEIRIKAPFGWDFRPLCNLYKDITDGCEDRCAYQLPYAEDRGHHICPAANILLLLLDTSRVIEPGVFVLLLGVINPAAAPSQNIWSVSLLNPALITGWTPETAQEMYADGFQLGQKMLTNILITGFHVGFRIESDIPVLPLAGDRFEVLNMGTATRSTRRSNWLLVLFVALSVLR